jgi:heat shock protein HtpX
MPTSAIDPHTWQQHAWRNRLQALFLLLTMGGFLALLGWLLWGGLGLVMLVVVGLTSLWFTPRLSPLLVMRLYQARAISPRELPGLWQVLVQVSENAGLEQVPALYYVPSRVLNAFAAGSRRHAAIAVTDGLLRSMNLRELAGVLAHEISHIRNNDLWVMNLADVLSRTTRYLSLAGQLLLLINLPLLMLDAVTVNWFAIGLLIAAPMLSALAQLALARNREYEADLGAARLTGDPEGLALALDKLERVQGGWMERLFLPRHSEPSTLRTHPETAERIQRLMSLKAEASPRVRVRTLQPRSPFEHENHPTPRRHLNGLWY